MPLVIPVSPVPSPITFPPPSVAAPLISGSVVCAVLPATMLSVSVNVPASMRMPPPPYAEFPVIVLFDTVTEVPPLKIPPPPLLLAVLPEMVLSVTLTEPPGSLTIAP